MGSWESEQDFGGLRSNPDTQQFLDAGKSKVGFAVPEITNPESGVRPWVGVVPGA